MFASYISEILPFYTVNENLHLILDILITFYSFSLHIFLDYEYYFLYFTDQTDLTDIMLQGDDEELFQPSIREYLPNMSQPNLLLQTTVLFLRYLHGFPQLPFKL